MEVVPHAICSDVELLAKCCCAAKFLRGLTKMMGKLMGKKFHQILVNAQKPQLLQNS